MKFKQLLNVGDGKICCIRSARFLPIQAVFQKVLITTVSFVVIGIAV